MVTAPSEVKRAGWKCSRFSVLYFHWFPLLQKLYTFSNPVCIKAALKILGLPGGHLRAPYEEFTGQGYAELEQMMDEMGVIAKYGV